MYKRQTQFVANDVGLVDKHPLKTRPPSSSVVKFTPNGVCCKITGSEVPEVLSLHWMPRVSSDGTLKLTVPDLAVIDCSPSSSHEPNTPAKLLPW